MKLLTSNDYYHPRRLRLGHACLYLGVIGLLVLAFLLTPLTNAKVFAMSVGNIARLSNDARTQNGLQPLVLNIQLSAAAQAKAQHMVDHNYFEHTAPDGITGWTFIEQQSYQYVLAGENLAASNQQDDTVVNGWLASPGHRANLLSLHYTDVGYGVAYKGDYEDYHDVYFIVALYAQPKTQQSTFVQGASTGNNQQSASGIIAVALPKIGSLKGNVIYGLAIGFTSLLLFGTALEFRHLRKSVRHLRATSE